MSGKEPAIINWAYRLPIALYEWVMDFVSEKYNWIFYYNRDFVADYLIIVISLFAVFVAISSLHYTQKTYEVSIRNNKGIIMRDRMIGAMNNVTSHVYDGGDYSGAGMCVSYPIRDKVRNNMGIISGWNQIPAQPENPKGNHHFVFTYRIFFGSIGDLNSILSEGDWSSTEESVTIHLVRTHDGDYTLTDRVQMKSYDEFISEGRTIYLEERNYDYVMMVLDTLMMWDLETLKKHQDTLYEYNENGSISYEIDDMQI